MSFCPTGQSLARYNLSAPPPPPQLHSSSLLRADSPSNAETFFEITEKTVEVGAKCLSEDPPPKIGPSESI